MARKSKIQSHGPDNKPDLHNNASGPPAEEEYKVGPGRPPKDHQFKPGQSGNPKGAKRKAPSLIPDLKELFERACNQKAKVTQGERKRVITMLAAGLQQLFVQFAKGDRHARGQWPACERFCCAIVSSDACAAAICLSPSELSLIAFRCQYVGDPRPLAENHDGLLSGDKDSGDINGVREAFLSGANELHRGAGGRVGRRCRCTSALESE
jgi:hypothetical protein